jgi:hypothetical protein
MVEAARAGSWHDGSGLRRRGEPDTGGKTHSGSEKCQKRSIANFHLSQIQIASGQDLHPREMTSAFFAPRSSLGQILNLSADRSRSRSTSIYDSPSTAHLTGLEVPAMLGVHASLDHVATTVVGV